MSILGFPEVNFSKTSMQFSNQIHPSLHRCATTLKKIILIVVYGDQPVAIGTICMHLHIHAHTCTCISARELKMYVMGVIRRLIGRPILNFQKRFARQKFINITFCANSSYFETLLLCGKSSHPLLIKSYNSVEPILHC